MIVAMHRLSNEGEKHMQEMLVVWTTCDMV